MAVVPDPRLARLLTAMRAVRDGDLGARAAVTGDDELAELGELFNELAEHNEALAGQIAGISGADALEQLAATVSAGVASAASAAARAASAEAVDATPAPGVRTELDATRGQSAADAAGDVADQIAQIEQARLDLNQHARQLALASRAKAEFMANISHELRTPLSSLLILARLLAANSEGNLTPRQLDFARTIHGAAQDLLQLVNDLLDLSQVEIGRILVRANQVAVVTLVGRAQDAIRQQAVDKGLELITRVSEDVPETIDSDDQRLLQILRNLLSNAVKFTDHGTITLEVARDPIDPTLLRFAVHDTGIGIPPDRQDAVFEAFARGENANGRHVTGSGLGLSISRELARLIGGELRVSSTPDLGSTFTLTVPIELPSAGRGPEGTRGGSHPLPRARGSQPAVAEKSGPAVSIDAAGVTATAAAQRSESEDYFGFGAPGGQAASVVLVVEPRAARAMQHAARTAIEGLGHTRKRIEPLVFPEVSTQEITHTLTQREVVAVLVNLSTPHPQVQSLLTAVALYAPTVPVLVYEAGAGSDTAGRLAFLGNVSGLEVVGSRAQAVERLTLHLLTALPAASPELSLAAEPPQSAIRFNGEKVLVVDDDVRNVFAITSALELHGLSVVHADNGRQGIDTLLQNPDIRLVLMDLMMPGMDGYAATEYIRGLEQFADLPIIAVTAKAMRGDRERSLAAGANEHVVKPVEIDVLLGLIGSMIGH